MNFLGRIVRLLLRFPILMYRYGVSPFLPGACRHLPTCSQYASDAIELNGAWKGGWLTLSRLLRCNPWGSHGLDPAPDIRHMAHPIHASWRYGCWTGAHITERFVEKEKPHQNCRTCDH